MRTSMNRKEGARRRTFHLRERNGGSVAGMVKVERGR